MHALQTLAIRSTGSSGPPSLELYLEACNLIFQVLLVPQQLLLLLMPWGRNGSEIRQGNIWNIVDRTILCPLSLAFWAPRLPTPSFMFWYNSCMSQCPWLMSLIYLFITLSLLTLCHYAVIYAWSQHGCTGCTLPATSQICVSPPEPRCGTLHLERWHPVANCTSWSTWQSYPIINEIGNRPWLAEF